MIACAPFGREFGRTRAQPAGRSVRRTLGSRRQRWLLTHLSRPTIAEISSTFKIFDCSHFKQQPVQPPTAILPHSHLNASVGLIRDALRAGTNPAATAVTVSASTAPAITATSRAFTPN